MAPLVQDPGSGVASPYIISFMVTVFNKRPYLPRVLAGLQSQVLDFQDHARGDASSSSSLSGVQYVFVDDGSTDGSLAYLREATKTWQNVSIISQPNMGPSRAFNTGLAACEGIFLKPLDGDDVLPPYATSLLYEALSHHPEAVLSFGGRGLLEAAGSQDLQEALETLVVGPKPPMLAWELIGRPLERSYKRAQILSPSGWLAKTAVVKGVGGCDIDVFIQDYSLELRMALQGPFLKTDTPVFFSPPVAPGRMSDNVGQTLHDLNKALGNLCMQGIPSKPMARRMYQRAASRAFRWVRRHNRRDPGASPGMTKFRWSCRLISALGRYAVSHLNVGRSVQGIGRSILQTCLSFEGGGGKGSHLRS